MNSRSAIALGATMLALALPGAATAQIAGGITVDQPSIELNGKAEVKAPAGVHGTVKVLGDVRRTADRLHESAGGKVAVGDTRIEAGQRAGAGSAAGVRVKVHSRPVKATVRVKAAVPHTAGRGLARTATRPSRVADKSRRAVVHATGAVHRSHRARPVRKAVHRHAQRPLGDARHATRHPIGRPLSAIGREVGNGLQPGLAGGLLLALAGLAGSVTRARLRRSVG
jgi:hypothetical protein